MEKLELTGSSPQQDELELLRSQAEEVVDLLRRPDCEARRPFFFEFAGTPKCGKSTIIGILGHFLRRTGFNVILPAEGASLRTPDSLRDDWLAFNTWSACYALRHILEVSHEREPPDVALLDRGLFDAAAWMRFLEVSQERLSDSDRGTITEFLKLDLWRTRERAVFLFTADRHTSLEREIHCKLTREHGSVMNPDILQGLDRAYWRAADELETSFQLFHADTSFVGGESPAFDRIAYTIAKRILDLMHETLDQTLLVTDLLDDVEGLEVRPDRLEPVMRQILNQGQPRFKRRSEAESDPGLLQVVPYAIVIGGDEQYLVAKRRADHPRQELRGKYTILLGGHAEQKDWDTSAPEAVFERCLRRELDEELIGLNIQAVKRVGIINDPRSRVGQKHLAVLFEVTVGGPPKIRRQAVDQEFGREAVSWQSGEQIKARVQDLDPWSQLVAQHKFGAKVPELPNEPTLFTRGRQEQ